MCQLQSALTYKEEEDLIKISLSNQVVVWLQTSYLHSALTCKEVKPSYKKLLLEHRPLEQTYSFPLQNLNQVVVWLKLLTYTTFSCKKSYWNTRLYRKEVSLIMQTFRSNTAMYSTEVHLYFHRCVFKQKIMFFVTRFLNITYGKSRFFNIWFEYPYQSLIFILRCLT